MAEIIKDNKPGGAGDERNLSLDFESIVSENSGRIYNLIYQMVGNAQETEELVQEVFYSAYKSLGRFKGDSSISTWLYRIAMNVATDSLRTKMRRPKVAESMDYEEREAMGGIERKGKSVESQFIMKESLQNVKEAMMKLPIKYRAPFVLNVVEGYSHEEIAEIMGITNGMARTRLYRALKMLRQELGAESGNR